MKNGLHVSIIKKIIPRKIKILIKNKSHSKSYKDVLNKLEETASSGRFIMMATPEHGNIGDHAITVAQHSFLNDYFPGKLVFEITGDCYRAQKSKISKKIDYKDTIVISGGGFIGSLWMDEENLVRDIIRRFPNNLIVIFPQTIFFENNRHGESEFEKSKAIFRAHNNLLLAVRDESSTIIARKLLGKDKESKMVFLPDIVAYLPHQNSDIASEREGLLVCLRQDKEKVLPVEVRNYLTEICDKYDCELRYTDTVVNNSISTDMRAKYFSDKLIEFSGSKLVVTDRLHGMLFSAITGTPCIALNNSSGKVAGVYKWIEYLNYIKLAKSIYEVPQLADKLMKINSSKYENKNLELHFLKFAMVIKKQINNY